ncbi:MAG: inositol-3-phosphate synthase [bacterium]|jgi:myo-inositol-1-phosphate synthase|nr:myo-inositol-1-phosphate synthase [Planctomycetota bacterium]HIL51808.1 myo-inositol-1-phosphate synthase [Planctomycetota bacterium]
MSRQSRTTQPVGLWLIGARGSISTCVAYGLSGIVEGRIGPVGLVTETEPLASLPLVPLENLVLGGHDVCTRSLTNSAAELVRSQVLPPDLVEMSAARAAAFDANIAPGLLDGPDVGFADLDPRSAELGSASPREQIERIQADLRGFVVEHGLEHLVVVNLASTEAWYEDRDEWDDLADFEAALDAERSQPASIIYAYSALDAGFSYVNFTPSRGSSSAALRALAEERGTPHAGSDGKTGETLLKTVLAPMFRARALKVRAWQGYNMLGNRDGEILHDPSHRISKLRNKDEALRSILEDPDMHSHVSIDFVPSLSDWKTAWDFVHFEGFLGAEMSLQFTWQGSDSALAAPLVLDLARLCTLSAARGEVGALAHLACFFKAPLTGGSHAFQTQFDALLDYAGSS